MRRKEYKYVDKDLLDIEKDYKSKENKILGQMKRVKLPEKEIEKETRSWKDVYPEKKQKKWEWEIVEFWMRPVEFFKNYIK